MSDLELKMPKIKKKKENYIDNKKFLEEIIKHKALVKEAEAKGELPPPISNYLGDCILKIGKGMAGRDEFVNYSFINEMISDGVENSLAYFNNFDPERVGERSGIVTPFGYFTQIMYYAFQRRILKEERQRYIKYKVTERFLLEVDNRELEEYSLNSDNITRFIKKYEEREKVKKEKREAKKLEKKKNALGIE